METSNPSLWDGRHRPVCASRHTTSDFLPRWDSAIIRGRLDHSVSHVRCNNLGDYASSSVAHSSLALSNHVSLGRARPA